MYRRRVNLKGTLPALVLEVLRRGPSHGYEIAQTIKRSSAGVLDFKEGTLYPALHTLENDGLIESDVENETGRPRRTYRLTKRGLKALERERLEWQAYSTAIAGILGGGS